MYPSKTMLIVDDAPVNRKILKKIFESDYAILEAENGLQALQMMEKYAQTLTAVLLDIRMPQMDGFAVLREIEKVPVLKKIPVIAITGEDTSEVDVLQCGAWDFISKPIQADIVRVRVENAVERKLLADMTAVHHELKAKAQILQYINEMPIAFFVLKTCDISEVNREHLVFDYCNQRFAALSKKSVSDIIGQRFVDVHVIQELLPAEIYTKIAFYGEHYAYEKTMNTNPRRDYSIRFYSPAQGYCACIIQDITHIRALEKKNLEALERENTLLLERNDEQKRYEIITNQTDSIVFEWNAVKKTSYFSDNVKNLAVVDWFANPGNLDGIYESDHAQLVTELLQPIMHGALFAETTVRMKEVSGKFIWFKISATCIYDEAGTLHRVIGTIKDVNNEVNYLNQLKYDAEYDTVTGIYNKRSFFRNTERLFVAHPDMPFLLIRFDINRFKIINELFGIEEGNRLLTFLGQQLKDATLAFQNSSYGRLEADVFCACVPNEPQKVSAFVARLEKVGDTYPLNFDIVPSIGLYGIEDRTLPIDVMCDYAKLALQTIKGNYLIRHASFDEEMSIALKREQEIVNMMNIALQEEQFQVYLQPKYNLENNSICGAEALARWIHPEKGIIYPKDFIPVFERNGFIMKLDAYIWEQVCVLLRKWMDEGQEPYPISVNISKVNLYNPQLCETILNLVKKYRIPPKLFQLELTESAYTDNKELLLEIMTRLQNYGFIMMMDDFGSGYSSLNMLKEIPVDVLKIDLRFLADNGRQQNKGNNILSSVVRMAKWLDLHIIAEGIETKEQSDFLRSIGCPDGQGYYFSKPIPVPAYEKLLKADTERFPHAEELILKNSMDIDAIWSPSAQANLLFSSIVSAIAIYEMHNGHIEILRANDGYIDMTGYDRGMLYNNTGRLKELIFEPDYENAMEIFRTAIQTQKDSNGEYRRYRKDGTLMWVRLRLKYLAQVGDRHVFYGALNDVTNEKKIEEELEQAHEKLRRQYLHVLRYRETIIANSVAYFELDLTDDVLLSMNDSNSFWLGHQKEETFDKLAVRVAQRMPAEDRPKFLEQINRSDLLAHYQTGTQELRMELRFALEKEKYCWIEGTFNLFLSAENDHIICTWTGKNINERKEQELLLKPQSEGTPLVTSEPEGKVRTLDLGTR